MRSGRGRTTLLRNQTESFLVRAVFLVGVILLAAALAPGTGSAATVQRVTLVVSDIEKSVVFYERLGLAKIHDEGRTGTANVHGASDLPLTSDPTRSRIVVMKGEGQSSELVLLWYDRPGLASARGNLMGLGTGDIIIGVTVPDLQAAYGALDRLGARIEKGPNAFTSTPLGVRLYAYDPDGHMVELTQAGR